MIALIDDSKILHLMACVVYSMYRIFTLCLLSYILSPLVMRLGLYMVGTKGGRGPPGPPGKCSCGSLSNSPFDDYPSRGNYPKVPAVRHQVMTHRDKTQPWMSILRPFLETLLL